jgi:hypothetical protein
MRGSAGAVDPHCGDLHHQRGACQVRFWAWSAGAHAANMSGQQSAASLTRLLLSACQHGSKLLHGAQSSRLMHAKARRCSQ